MPRTGRLHLDGGYYHVIGRGLERRRIFSGDDDKEDFLERLGIGLAQAKCQCLAFAVMSNHYHLLIRVSDKPLSLLMSKLLSGYATQYNRRKNRSGYVFQNRYKSILCDADSYLLELIRYIHLNPLKAKMVESVDALDRYRWTGHASLADKHSQHWYSRNEVLHLFSRNQKTALKRYRSFIEEGVVTPSNKDLSGGGLIRSYGGWESVRFARQEHEARIGDERILGGSDFVESVLKNDILKLNIQTNWQKNGWNIERLALQVCDYCGIQPAELLQKGRQNAVSTAKSLLCYWSINELRLSSTELAIYLGISQPAVSKSCKRGFDYCRRNELEFDDLLREGELSY